MDLIRKSRMPTRTSALARFALMATFPVVLAFVAIVATLGWADAVEIAIFFAPCLLIIAMTVRSIERGFGPTNQE